MDAIEHFRKQAAKLRAMADDMDWEADRIEAIEALEREDDTLLSYRQVAYLAEIDERTVANRVSQLGWSRPRGGRGAATKITAKQAAELIRGRDEGLSRRRRAYYLKTRGNS